MTIWFWGRAARPMAKLFAAVVVAALSILSSSAEAKVPGRTYCFNSICHRVNTIPEMVALVGRDQIFKTSFYDDCKRDRFNPCGLTSSGEVFRPGDADNAASPIYPNGTILLIRNPSNGMTAVVRINNAGPYWGKRKLDVSRGTAERLGFKSRGVADLEVRVVAAPRLEDTKYKKNRRYNPVPGPIGTFASLDRAQGGMVVAMALNAMSGSAFAPVSGKMLSGLKSASPALASALRGGDKVAAATLDAREAAGEVDDITPAEGLKAEARRTFGVNRKVRWTAPSSLMADAIAPIHRSRPFTEPATRG